MSRETIYGTSLASARVPRNKTGILSAKLLKRIRPRKKQPEHIRKSFREEKNASVLTKKKQGIDNNDGRPTIISAITMPFCG
jgi:hypothetical protein